MTDHSSLFKVSGLPDSFGALLLVFSFVLLLAPYFSGADFGVFKIPAFTMAAKKWLRIIGPVLFMVCIVSFIPIIPIKNSLSEVSPDIHNGPDTPKTTSTVIPNAPMSRESPDPALTVDFGVTTFTGAHVLIGNEGQGIILVRDLTINWDYSECPKFEEPSVGAPLVEYRYNVDLTTSKGSKLLDPKTFKYGSGDADNFLVDLRYPGYGVYTVWLSFKHKRLGQKTEQVYETERAERWVCEKF